MLLLTAAQHCGSDAASRAERGEAVGGNRGLGRTELYLGHSNGDDCPASGESEIRQERRSTGSHPRQFGHES